MDWTDLEDIFTRWKHSTTQTTFFLCSIKEQICDLDSSIDDSPTKYAMVRKKGSDDDDDEDYVDDENRTKTRNAKGKCRVRVIFFSEM